MLTARDHALVASELAHEAGKTSDQITTRGLSAVAQAHALAALALVATATKIEATR